MKSTLNSAYALPDGEVVVVYAGGEIPIDAKPYDPPPPIPPTPAQILASLTRAVQDHLDATARTRNYDGILSLCSYATSTNPKFGPEGQAGVAWRDAVWSSCYAILADVQAGNRAAPSAAGLLTELPSMEWPA